MLRDFIVVNGGLVRAVKIVQDFREGVVNEEKLKNYFVNESVLTALSSISEGLHPTSRQRVHLISGTYGSGKSHLGLVLANYLTRRSSDPQLEMIFRRVAERDPHQANDIRARRDNDRPYLLVLLEGLDPDGARHALLEGVRLAVDEAGISEDALQTSFGSAVRKIEEWERERPEFAERLGIGLEAASMDLPGLKSNLASFVPAAYRKFKQLHSEITTSEFVPGCNEDTASLYQQLAGLIRGKHERSGIVVIWDQFNEHLESTAAADLQREVAFIRGLAEVAVRSGEDQLHLILISHNLPHVYVQGRLSKEALDNWTTFEGRISKKHPIAAVEDAEGMIRNAITKTADSTEWKAVCDVIDGDSVTTDRLQELNLYPGKERTWLVGTVYKGGFPLHPIAAYCLPRISNVVGQAARTMFTFLEDTDKAGGLGRFIQQDVGDAYRDGLHQYRADQLYDYFEDVIRDNPDTRGIARDCEDAISKLSNPQEEVSRRVLKAVALLKVIACGYQDTPLRPRPDVLGMMLGIDEPMVARLLNALQENHVVWSRRDGGFDFRTGPVTNNFGDDFQKACRAVSMYSPTLALGTRAPVRDIRTRRYTEDHGVLMRILEGRYVCASDIVNASFYVDSIVREYKDGFVLRVLAESDEELQEAKKLAIALKNPQLVVAVPLRPLSLTESLRNLAALDSMRTKQPYAQEDTQAYKEWRDRYDAETGRFAAEMDYWRLPQNSAWFAGGRQLPVSEADESAIADSVMREVFSRTPRIEHAQTANMYERDLAKERVNLSTQILNPDKNYVDIPTPKGRTPPEKPMLERVFEPQGMLKVTKGVNSTRYELTEPVREPTREIWAILRKRLTESGRVADFAGLVRELRLPPYGLSPRVIELFVASFIHCNPNRFTFKIRKTKSSQLELRVLDGTAVFDAVKDPDAAKVTLEYREQLPCEADFYAAIASVLAEPRDMGASPGLDEVAGLLRSWCARIPTVTLKAADLAEKGKAILSFCTRCQEGTDVASLLFRDLPMSLGINKELSLWGVDDTTVLEFEAALKEAVEAVDAYSKVVADRVLKMLAGVFEARGHARSEIAAKVENWYRDLDPSVKQTPFRGDAGKLLTSCNMTVTDDVDKRFLVDLPQALIGKAFTEWEDVPSALERYESKLRTAKIEVENRQRKVAPPPRPETLSKAAERLTENLRERIRKSRKVLSQSEIIHVLESILAECRKEVEPRK